MLQGPQGLAPNKNMAGDIKNLVDILTCNDITQPFRHFLVQGSRLGDTNDMSTSTSIWPTMCLYQGRFLARPTWHRMIVLTLKHCYIVNDGTWQWQLYMILKCVLLKDQHQEWNKRRQEWTFAGQSSNENPPKRTFRNSGNLPETPLALKDLNLAM